MKGRVRPAVVVEPNGLFDCLSCLFSIQEGPAEPILLFEDSVESFGDRVFGAVIELSHAYW